jgi:hypothetical protein
VKLLWFEAAGFLAGFPEARIVRVFQVVLHDMGDTAQRMDSNEMPPPQAQAEWQLPDSVLGATCPP